MEVIALVLAIPPVLEQLVKAGRNLALRVEAIQNPRSKFGDLSNFTQHDIQLLARFKVGQQINNDSNVSSDIRNSLAKDFIDIQKVILEALECVERVERSSKMHRFWVMDKPRRVLEEIVRRLETLLRSFQDTVELVYMSSSLPSQVFLQSNVFQPTAAMESVKITESMVMRQGHLAQAFGRVQPKTGWFICEGRPYIESAKKTVERDIRSLSELLSSASACCNILDIVGYRDMPVAQQYEIVFDFPEHFNFVSNLQQFIQNNQPVPLNFRVEFSRQLADAILQVHRLNLVHKNVNCGNIVVLRDSRPPVAGKSAWELFLVNWHLVRKASAATQLLGEPKWWQGIYQHPTRQLVLAEKEYTMAHDIYSLGVCMLELLSWSALVVQHPDSSQCPSDLFKAEALHLQVVSETEWIEAIQTSREGGVLMNGRDIQKVLISLAKRKLPAAAGDRLAQLVVSCLMVLEGGFGDSDLVQPSRVETGLNFVAAVKNSLTQVCI